MTKHIHIHFGKTRDVDIGLWKYNKTTGFWSLERKCADDTASKWLNIFKTDEPDSFFKLSKNRPSGKP
jgi:hypothetical protein